MLYHLDNKTDFEVGNRFPQVGFDAVKEAFKFRGDVFPESHPTLSATLEKGAKITDILSQASIMGQGLLVNQHIKNILEDFNLTNHKYYSCPVTDHNTDTHQYYWLCFAQTRLLDLINFNSSSFFVKIGLKNQGPITLKSFDDYLTVKKTLDSSAIIKAETLLYTHHDYDLFKFPLFDSKMYVSENLRNALINTTGVAIKEVPVS